MTPRLLPPPRRAARAPLAALLVAALVGGGSAHAQGVRVAKDAAPPSAHPIASTPTPPAAATSAVLPGVEVLLRDSLHLLRGKRVGLITNPTGRDRAGRSTVDLLFGAPGVRLVALYGPEHGIRGAAEAGEKVASGRDSATGLPVHSLYGATRVPTREMLRDVDVLVYDIQDVGARVYTYVWTMALAADSAGVPFVVLDRPDPVRADRVDGGVLDPAFASFVGLHPVAMRYGLTPGELLRWLAATGRVKAPAVHVVPMQGYRRTMWWDETGLPWVNPSPNLRTLDATLLYTGTVFVEGTNLSEGRGTDRPFQLVGAPWLTDAEAIAAALNARVARGELAGVRFAATTRAVAAGQKHGGLTIPMVEITVTDRDRVRPAAVGAWLLREIRARHPQAMTWRARFTDQLAGDGRLRAAVDASDDAVRALLAAWEGEANAFARATAAARLYR